MKLVQAVEAVNNNTLEVIDLGHTLVRKWFSGFEKINATDFQSLADALVANANGRTKGINLMGNDIGPKGAKALAKVFETNRSLNWIDLRFNSIGDAGVHDLMEVLKKSNRSVHIDLSWNGISDHGAKDLLDALIANSYLSINVDQNNINESVEGRILQLTLNRSVQTDGPSQVVNQESSSVISEVPNTGNNITATRFETMGGGVTINSTIVQPQLTVPSMASGKEEIEEGFTIEQVFKMMFDKYKSTIFERDISLELVDKIVDEVDRLIGKNLRSDLNNLVRSHEGQKQIATLHDKVLKKISRRQQNLSVKLSTVQDEMKKIQDKQDPLYKEYENEQENLREQMALQQPEAVKAFYNFVETNLAAKLISAYILAVGMIARGQSKTEKVTEIGANIAGAAIGGITMPVPIVSGIVGSLTGIAITEAVGGVKDYIQDKKYENVAGSIIYFKDILIIAELTARKLATDYSEYIIRKNLSIEQAQDAAKNVVRIMYNFIKTGKLVATLSLADKVKLLINAVHETTQQQKKKYFSKNKKGKVFADPIAPSSTTVSAVLQSSPSISPGSYRKVHSLTKGQQNLKKQLDLNNAYSTLKIESLENKNVELEKMLQEQKELTQQLQIQLEGMKSALQVHGIFASPSMLQSTSSTSVTTHSLPLEP